MPAAFLAAIVLLSTSLHAQVNQQTYPAEYYKIVTSTNKCLDIEGQNQDANARLVVWDCNGGQNQQFQFTPIRPGVFRITARHSGKALTVSSDSSVHQQPFQNMPFQQFQLIQTPGAQMTFRIGTIGALTSFLGANGSSVVLTSAQPVQSFHLDQVAVTYPCNPPTDYRVNPASSVGVTPITTTFIDRAEDRIMLTQSRLPALANQQLKLTLMTSGNVTWWKGIEILDAENRKIRSVDNFANRTDSIDLTNYNPGTLKLLFLKAKTLGVHTGMYSVCGLTDQKGQNLVFDWQRD